MSPTDIVLFMLALLLLLVWVPLIVWITVQCGVYSFLMARRRFNLRYREKFNGSWEQEQES